MDTVKKIARLFIGLSLFGLVANASSLNYCSRSELQFFNTYAASTINPAHWGPTSNATVLFGYRSTEQDEATASNGNYLVKFSFHAKNEETLVLRGDIHQVETPTPQNKRGLCWKTSLYFTYDLKRPDSFPEVSTADGVSVPLIGDNLNFKTCELLSRTLGLEGSASHREIISGQTEEGDQYTFWMTYAKPNSILKAYEGQRTKNAQTVFFETVGLKN